MNGSHHDFDESDIIDPRAMRRRFAQAYWRGRPVQHFLYRAAGIMLPILGFMLGYALCFSRHVP